MSTHPKINFDEKVLNSSEISIDKTVFDNEYRPQIRVFIQTLNEHTICVQVFEGIDNDPEDEPFLRWIVHGREAGEFVNIVTDPETEEEVEERINAGTKIVSAIKEFLLLLGEHGHLYIVETSPSPGSSPLP